MGVIIMRTLLSIMPILSREYDQHFKSFTGVPVDKSKIGQSTSSADLAGQQGEDGEPKESGNNSESEVEKDKETGERGTKGRGTPTEAASVEEVSTGPKMRGSRCFEVLGYDIMLDSNLNPWVIEVNHLPRYVLVFSVWHDVPQELTVCLCFPLLQFRHGLADGPGHQAAADGAGVLRAAGDGGRPGGLCGAPQGRVREAPGRAEPSQRRGPEGA
jgi:hypothetical protein